MSSHLVRPWPAASTRAARSGDVGATVHRQRSGFTLIELLVVVAILALLISILLPSLAAAKRNSKRVACMANVRSLCLAQAAYAAEFDGALVEAGNGSYDMQGSWIALLQGSGKQPLVRRCPSDESIYFTTALPGSVPPSNRVTSYAINNYVSPTHTPAGAEVISRLSQIRRPASVIQFAELAETGTYAGADHLHVDDFFYASAPSITVNLIGQQMPLGIHDAPGTPASMQSKLNFGFLDGHAETLPLGQAYTDPLRNLFNPLVAR